MYIFGGLGSNGYKNDLYIYDIHLKKWSKPNFTGDKPSSRHLHTALIYNEKMFIFGGKNDTYLNDIFEYDFELNHWSKIEESGDVPQKRYGHTAVQIFGTMLISGGYGDQSYLNGNILYFN